MEWQRSGLLPQKCSVSGDRELTEETAEDRKLEMQMIGMDASKGERARERRAPGSDQLVAIQVGLLLFAGL